MNTNRPPNLPERNPETHQKHRHEVFWQITFPLLVGGSLLLLAVVTIIWAGVSGAGNLSKLADLSLIWLILIGMVMTFIFLLIGIALAYAVTWILRLTPPYARLVQDAFSLLGARIRKGSDAAVEPILRFEAFRASLRSLRRR